MWLEETVEDRRMSDGVGREGYRRSGFYMLVVYLRSQQQYYVTWKMKKPPGATAVMQLSHLI